MFYATLYMLNTVTKKNLKSAHELRASLGAEFASCLLSQSGADPDKMIIGEVHCQHAVHVLLHHIPRITTLFQHN